MISRPKRAADHLFAFIEFWKNRVAYGILKT